jgi:hypothetical protein
MRLKKIIPLLGGAAIGRGGFGGGMTRPAGVTLPALRAPLRGGELPIAFSDSQVLKKKYPKILIILVQTK